MLELSVDHSIVRIIEVAMSKQVSDIHLTAGLTPVFRILGELHDQKKQGIITKEDIESFLGRYGGEGSIKRCYLDKFYDTSFEICGTRFRAHFHIQSKGLAVALRPVPKKIPNIDTLMLPDVVSKFTSTKNGIVLVTGTTGSGKSTTLASIINEINKHQRKHIITVEDPIEFEYENIKCIIDQKEVGSHVSSFSSALRSAMREDPDILLVGELRDLDTIANAITMAETGHLVFGTLHTKSAAETVGRMVDVFPPEQQQQIRVLLSSTLRGVVSQTLVKSTNGGRVPVCEVMIVNDAIRAQIRDPKGSTNGITDQIQMTTLKLGAQTFNHSLAGLYKKGLVTMDTVLECAEESSNIEKLMQLLNS